MAMKAAASESAGLRLLPNSLLQALKPKAAPTTFDERVEWGVAQARKATQEAMRLKGIENSTMEDLDYKFSWPGENSIDSDDDESYKDQHVELTVEFAAGRGGRAERAPESQEGKGGRAERASESQEGRGRGGGGRAESDSASQDACDGGSRRRRGEGENDISSNVIYILLTFHDIYIYVCVCLSGAGLERLAGKVLLNLSFKKRISAIRRRPRRSRRTL